MHDFGWQCSPVERAGTEAPPCRDAVAAKPAVKPGPEVMPLTKQPVTNPRTKTTDEKAEPPTRRKDKPDNLQQISGIGPKLEKTLHGLGIKHFDQIAAWKKSEIEDVNEKLRFKGRIEREEWVPQAKLLAAGKTDEFEKKYGTGGLKNKSGQTKSGTRTRRS